MGLLPWSRDWKHLSGFLPGKIAPEQYSFLARMREGRLEAIEAEVVHRMRRNN